MRVVGAELRKILSTRLWWVLLIILIGYVAFTAAVIAAAFGGFGQELSGASGGEMPPLPPDALPPLTYSVASSIGYVFPVLLGALATTGEFHHKTITPTFLVTPRRGRVLLAKQAVILLFGAIFGLGAVLGAAGPGAGILAATGNPTGLDDPDTWALLGRMVIAMAIWALLGVGLGALIPSQVAVIVVVIVFTQFIEPIVRMVAGFWEVTAGVAKFLPGSAGDALVGASLFSAFGAGDSGLLEWWQGGLVLLAYALIAGLAGYLTTWRKDVS